MRPETREKRVAMTIEVAFRARERAYDRKKASATKLSLHINTGV